VSANFLSCLVYPDNPRFSSGVGIADLRLRLRHLVAKFRELGFPFCLFLGRHLEFLRAQPSDNRAWKNERGNPGVEFPAPVQIPVDSGQQTGGRILGKDHTLELAVRVHRDVFRGFLTLNRARILNFGILAVGGDFDQFVDRLQHPAVMGTALADRTNENGVKLGQLETNFDHGLMLSPPSVGPLIGSIATVLG